ncbi:hypothetical protein DCC81_23280 [Chitinophaga parva]|uniref:Uncharacterized protein n=1 Tax=Chitinophaga parva TaxID=2169414 RepID=A0A2T7BDZ9_9BACT|nr:hypothetical protein DCC81_23280 [Chitinophaga parva]
MFLRLKESKYIILAGKMQIWQECFENVQIGGHAISRPSFPTFKYRGMWQLSFIFIPKYLL